MNDTISRNEFLRTTAMAEACGSVSNRYIPQLQTSSLIQIVSLCAIKYDGR
jgi:hypothetical protein